MKKVILVDRMDKFVKRLIVHGVLLVVNVYLFNRGFYGQTEPLQALFWNLFTPISQVDWIPLGVVAILFFYFIKSITQGERHQKMLSMFYRTDVHAALLLFGCVLFAMFLNPEIALVKLIFAQLSIDLLFLFFYEQYYAKAVSGVPENLTKTE